MNDAISAAHDRAAAWPDSWPDDESALADAIGVHARRRIAHGDQVSLREYLRRVPGLEGKPIALDIAIEAALLSAVGGRGGRRDLDRAGKMLAAEYPELRAPILEAATLSALMCSTGALRARLHADALPTPPCDFGPQFTKSERRFRLVGLLGMGAHGAVYLAIDRALSEADRPAQVAIKVTLADAVSDPASGAQIIEEGAKARRVDHPNVVKVYDAGTTEEGLAYIVTEYVSGGSLRKGNRAVRPPAACDAAARLTAEIADGVQAMHSAGLIHFDLKPDNILMTETGAPKVSDLSLAIRESERLMSGAGADPTAGTIGFMAPEQLRGDVDNLDSRADLYALGGMLYWLLTDEFPNQSALTGGWGYDEQRAERMRSKALVHAPGDVRAIVMRALAPDPEKRYATAAQLADDLRLYIERRPIRWTRPSTARVAKLWVRRRPILAGALLATALAAVGVGYGFIQLDSRARAREVEARIAAAELEAETRWKQQAGDFLNIFRGRWGSLVEQGVAGEAFGTLWATEYLLGSGFLENPDDERATRFERLELLRTLFEDSVDTQGLGAVETLVYGSAAAYWALRLDEPAAAERILHQVEEGWAARLGEGDRWSVVLDVLNAAALFRLAETEGAGVDTDAARTRLTGLRDQLEGLPDAGPLRILVDDLLSEPPSESANEA